MSLADTLVDISHGSNLNKAERIVLRRIAIEYEDLEKLVDEAAKNVNKLQARTGNVKIIAEKYAKASEYKDELIEGRFVKMSGTEKQLVNQVGKEILEALKGST